MHAHMHVCADIHVCVCVCVQAHLRSTELENTKLSAELQMLKAVELNREVTIAQFQEELDRLRACVAQRDILEKELQAARVDKVGAQDTYTHTDTQHPSRQSGSLSSQRH